MKRILGFFGIGFWAISTAWGAGAPLLLDWGVVDTSSAAQQKASLAIRKGTRAATVQKLSDKGTAPWLVQFNDVIQEEWKTALEAAGAELKGYIPENAFLVEASPEAIVRISAQPEVTWVGEYLPAYKRAKPVREMLAKGNGDIREYDVILFRPEDRVLIGRAIAELSGTFVTVIDPLSDRGLVRARLPISALETISGWGEVEWIEPYVEPKLCNDVAVRTNKMNVSNAWTTLGLTGAGQIIAVCDTGLDTGNLSTLHKDFTNRVVWTQALGRTGDWSDLNSHGTHVAGSVLGNGTMSTGRYKGVAYEASLVFQSVEDIYGKLKLPSDLNNLFRAAYTNGARIHSDSWGAADNGQYSAYSRDLDMFVWSNKTMLVLMAAGNEGTDANSNGVVDLDSMDSPGTAKNCLTVGAAENYRTLINTYAYLTNDFKVDPIKSDYMTQPDSPQGMAAFSSRGPCDDGRIKPDIVAPGTYIISTRSRATTNDGGGVVSANTNYLYMGGTSMATPLTAGAAGLARQWLVEKAGITNPSAALLKALLINGARDMAPGQYGTGIYQEIPTTRPNNVQGFGHVDLFNTLSPPTNQFMNLYDTNSLSTGQTNTFTLTVTTTSTNKFILTMAYSDYFASSGAGPKLVNDLDMTVQKPSGTTLYANGGASRDKTNNVEMIEFAADEFGAYTVKVVGRNVPSGGSQPYALVVRGPKADETPAAPVFDPNPGPLTATVSELMEFTVTAAGYPTPVLALQSTTATDGYIFEEATGYCIYEPPAADVGTNTFTFTATNASGSDTQTVSVVVYEAPPVAPTSIWASVTNSTDFTAAWSSVSDATSYRLDVGTNAAFSGGGGAGEILVDEGFDGGSTAPTGWTFTSIGDTYASAGNYGTASPSLKMDATGDTVQTPSLANPTNIDFWIKGQTTDSSSALLVEGASGGNWNTVTNVVPLPTSGTRISSTLGTSVTNLRFTYTKSVGNLAFDDVLVTGGASAPSYVPGYSNRTVASASESVTGLNSGATYYFRARAVNGGGTSPNSPTASVTTTVSAVAPTFGANPGPVATTAGVAVAFTVSASGSPTPALALQSQTASSGYSFNSGTGQMNYTPPQADAGSRTFTFSASNSQGVAYQTVTAAVTAATLPAFTGGAGPYSTTAGVAMAFTVSASGTPAATLALQSQTVSGGFSFNPATGAFTYTPPVGDVGAPTFTFTASNAAGIVAQTTTVNVAAMPTVPDAPVSIWASATNSTDFTAAWSSVSGVTGYRLDVGTNNTFTGGGGASVQSVLASNAATSPSALTNGWSGVDLAGTTYIQMLQSSSAITSAAFSTEGFTNLAVACHARTFGGASGTSSNITVSISTNNGTNWNSIGVVAPSSKTFAAMPTLTNTANLGNSQTRIRWQTLGATGTIGVGISNLVVQGWSAGAGAPSYVSGYENLDVGNVTTHAVTGLTASSTYHFRARAVNAVGTGAYSSVTTVTTLPKSNQMIMFSAIADQLTTNTVGLSATAASGLEVTFTVESGPATIAGGTNLTFTSAGAVSIVASQSGNANWNPAPNVTNTFTVTKATAGVTLGSLTQTYDGTARKATATTVPAGLSVGFTYNGSTEAPLNVGSYAVTGTVSDTIYQGVASDTLVVSKAVAMVTLDILTQTYDGTARIVSATTTPNGLAVALTYAGNAWAPTNAGSYAVTGTVNNMNYSGFTNSTLVVMKANQAISFAEIGAQVVTNTVHLSATASSGLPVSFAVVSGSATLSGETSLSFTGPGLVSIAASQTGDANWAASPKATNVFNVTKAAAIVTLGDLAQTYDGAAKSATATTDPAGLAVDFTYAGNAWAPTNAGSYAVSGTVSDTNYEGLASGFLVIGKATAAVTLGGLEQTYDGAAKGATATTDPTGLTVDFTYAGNAWAPTNAGNYAVTGLVNDVNYEGSSAAKLKIAKAAVAVMPNAAQSKMFGAADPAVFTCELSEAVDVTGALGRVAGEDVGSYAYTLGNLSAGANHELVLAAEAEKFSITTKAVTVSPNAAQGKVFGAADPAAFTYELSAAVDVVGALGRVAGEDVGSYAYTLGNLSAGANYELSLAAEAETFAITAKPVTVTPDADQGKVYGAADPAAFTYELSEAVDVTGALGREIGEDVGSYAFTMDDLSAGDNYTLALADPSPTFAIMAKPVTVTPDADQGKVYDAADPVAFTYELSEVVTVTGALGRVPGSDVGTYAYTLGTLSAGDNYALALADPSPMFAITAKAVTVTPDADKSKVYGAADPAAFTYELSEAVDVTGALGRAPGSDVGTYAYTLGTLSAGDNYTLALADPSPTFAITAKPVTVTPDADQSKVYGAADPAAFTYELSEAVDVTGALGREIGEDVGSYAFTMGDLSAGGNYALSLVENPAAFSIRTGLATIDVDIWASQQIDSHGYSATIATVPVDAEVSISVYGSTNFNAQSNRFDFAPLAEGEYEVSNKTVTILTNALYPWRLFRMGATPK